MSEKKSDRVFGCHAAVEVAMVGISDEDVDKLHKESYYGINRPKKDETVSIHSPKVNKHNRNSGNTDRMWDAIGHCIY